MKPVLLRRAGVFAAMRHMGQVRKYTGEPYIVHPIRVQLILHELGFREEVLAAALLHDVVEDCNVQPELLRQEFGEEVERLVMEVTDVSRPTDGNRKIRKAKDRDHLAGASSEGQSIKVADLIDNTASIVENDPNFAKVYLPEKRELLGVLTAAHPTLLGRAWGQV